MDETFLHIDLPALIVSVLAALCCSVLGSFLVLRRQAMMSDALSHVVLPGLAGAYLIAGSVHSPAMMAGALAACLLAVLLIHFLKSAGRIESGASMGIVFTSMFAIGLVMLETQIGARVHLDAQHALYGSLELTYWPEPLSWATLPLQIKTLGALTVLVFVLIYALFKEFKLTSFDPVMASVLGFKSHVLSTVLMIATALTAVACFEAVGSILVVALFICPAASARMFCDTLKGQIQLSAVFGVSSAVIGYGLAVFLPLAFGFEHALSGAGMIAVTAGFIQLCAMLFAPKYGYLAFKTRR